MSKRARAAAAGVALVVMAIGCDGDSGAFTTSAPSNKRLADLTPAERGQLCMDLARYAQTLAEDSCRLAALFTVYLQTTIDTTATDAELQQTCSMLTADCVAAGVTTTCDPVPATCTATVGEFSACISDAPRVLQAVPPCSAAQRATLESTIMSIENQPTTAACATLDMKCPETAMSMPLPRMSM